MRTFIIRARKGSTDWRKIRDQIGSQNHFEIIAHSVINAFFVSQNFRTDVEFYIVLDSAEDFPRTLKLSSAEGLSLAGFHEEAVLSIIEEVLKKSVGLEKNETRILAPGIQICGFGFEKLIQNLRETREIYLLDRKGEDIRAMELDANPVFILSDHLPMPKNNIKALKNSGAKLVSLGRKMLFASQCVVIINYEMDRMNF